MRKLVTTGFFLIILDFHGAHRAGAEPSLAPTITEFTLPAASGGSFGITSGSDGALWFTDNSGRIGRITTAGAITQFTLPTAGNSSASFITSGSDGALWFTDEFSNNIGRITTTGVITEFPAPTAGFYIASGPGALWFTEYQANKIGRITTTGIVTEFSVPTAGSAPGGITEGHDGALWFVEANANKIARITTSGAITEFKVPTANSGLSDITSGPDGALWFTEFLANRIGRITPAGAVTEFNIPTNGSSPTGITSGRDGALWFAEYKGNKIGRITAAGAVTEFFVPTASSLPLDITSGPDGGIWFTESFGNKIGRVSGIPPSTTGRGAALDPAVGPAVAPIFGTRNPGQTQTFSVLGRVMNGAVAGSTVRFYRLNAGGTKGPLLTSEMTDSDGFYSATFSASASDLIVAESSGGSYRDEATGNAVSLSSSDVLSAVFPAGTVQVAITPLTHMAAARAGVLAAGGESIANAVGASNAGVGGQYQVSDIIQLLPVAVDDATEAATGTRDQRDYGLVLAGIAEEANSLGVRAIDIAQALAADMSDGTLDGKNGGSPITIARELSGIELEDLNQILGANAGTTAVQSGIGSFIAGDRNVAELPTCYVLSQPLNIGSGPYTTSAVAPPAISGQTYSSGFLNINGGTPPWAWASAPGGLPNWLSISPGGTLRSEQVPVLSGGNVAQTFFGLSVTAKDKSNPQKTLVVQFQITIVPAPPSIQPHDGQCVVNTPCRVLVATASGGTPAYTFKLDTIGNGTCLLDCPSGQAPPGMFLDFSSGEMYGTPTTAGGYEFSVCVVDSAGQYACVDPTITVTDATVTLAPPSQSFGAGGGPGSVTVDAPDGYAWNAVSNDDWIVVTSGFSGTGPGTVTYSVAANTGSTQRTGGLTIAGIAFPVTQAGNTANPFDGSYTGIFEENSGCNAGVTVPWTFAISSGAINAALNGTPFGSGTIVISNSGSATFELSNSGGFATFIGMFSRDTVSGGVTASGTWSTNDATCGTASGTWTGSKP